MKYILLIGGIVLALFGELLEKEGDKKEKNTRFFKKLTIQGVILIVAGLLLSCFGIYQTYSEEKKAEQDRIAIIKKNTEDSLRQEKIIFNTNKQLSDALAIYKNTDRSLHPFFPLTLTIKYSIPFSSPEIKPLTKYLYALKKNIEANPKQSPVPLSGWGYQNGILHRLNIDYSSKLNSILSYDSYMGFFEISLIKGSLEQLKSFNDTVLQMHFEVSGSKNRTIQFEANYDSGYADFSVTYHDIEFEANSEQVSNTIFGSNELRDLFIVVHIDKYPNDKKILRELKFHPTAGHLEKCFIRFQPDELFRGYNHRYFFQKITNNNFEYWDEDNQ